MILLRIIISSAVIAFNPLPSSADCDFFCQRDRWERIEYADVEKMLDDGIYIDRIDDAGDTFLTAAAKYKNEYFVKKLLDRGAEVNVYGGSLQTSPLHNAVSRGRDRMVNILLSAGADIKARDILQHTPLHLAINGVYGKHLVPLLLSKGADPNAQNEHRKTPLNFAAFHNDVESIRTLLNAGADIEGRGYPPLLSAAESRKGPLDAFVLLIEAGADISANVYGEDTILHLAAGAFDYRIFEYVMGWDVDVNVQNTSGETPLHRVSRSRYMGSALDKITLLLAKGANLEARDEYGLTPLLVAIRNSNIGVIEYLINSGASTKAKSNEGESAYHLGTKNEDLLGTELLDSFKD